MKKLLAILEFVMIIFGTFIGMFFLVLITFSILSGEWIYHNDEAKAASSFFSFIATIFIGFFYYTSED